MKHYPPLDYLPSGTQQFIHFHCLFCFFATSKAGELIRRLPFQFIQIAVFLTLSITLPTSLIAQHESQTKSEEKFEYQVNGYVLLHRYNRQSKEVSPDDPKIEAGHYRYNVIGENTYKEGDLEFKYLLIQINNFTSKIGPVTNPDGSPTTKIKIFRSQKQLDKDKALQPYYEIDNRLDVVDIGDQGEYFWVKEERFNQLLEQGYIQKRYFFTPQFAYGASLTIPFKIRPEVRELNMKITPELSLGGYLGMRGRIHRYKNIYWYAPVITAGVTTLGINSDNVISEEQVDDSVKDGLVLARTFSVGSFIEFNSFQIGAVVGWDKAGGEIGKEWVYNDRLWYSFSIGYNFLRKKDD